ncbi:hypothetical protein L6164_018013 [Bauhinia variegata]|uniref:Uncharacterized protein n=1 Tax=Bauhinia variegata TaxID=167791 RepID=A0ACB9N9V4_BAUVA|nr:hypothetical protein L6164_018013 [Bauhinia variegata]
MAWFSVLFNCFAPSSSSRARVSDYGQGSKPKAGSSQKPERNSKSKAAPVPVSYFPVNSYLSRLQLDEGQDLYIRMAAPKIEAEYGHKKSRVIVATVMVAISVMLLLGCYCVYKIIRKEKSKDIEVYQTNLGREDDPDLPLFDLSTIAVATENFSIENKIGEGGFGSVYRGRLLNGQEIAIKRLSRSSVQGMAEFKNERLYREKKVEDFFIQITPLTLSVMHGYYGIRARF